MITLVLRRTESLELLVSPTIYYTRSSFVACYPEEDYPGYHQFRLACCYGWFLYFLLVLPEFHQIRFKVVGWKVFSALCFPEQQAVSAKKYTSVAGKIEKKRVLCFLKYFDKLFKGKTERTYTILALYAREEPNCPMAQAPSNLAVGEMLSTVQKKAPNAVEKEHQMFSPSTKQVIEEIACTVGMDERTVLTGSAAKRGLVFHDNSAENEAALSTDESPSPSHDIPAPNVGPQSPVKKLKNKVSGA